MTLAIDRKTGKVCGQVTVQTFRDRVLHGTLHLLTREGYVTVDAASVRLERVED